MIDQGRLKEILHYDPATGVFTWIARTAHRLRVGDAVSAINVNGYLRVCIEYKKYYLHRLAWLYMTGRWPDGQIDHRNTIRTDNRWDNLREADNRLNNENRRVAHRGNRSGELGVKQLPSGKFAGRIQTRGRDIHLGTFDSAAMAHAAYVAAKRKLHAGCTL